MGHLAGKDIFKKLGVKIDNLTVKTPWNETFFQILKELYTPEEAEILLRMPYTLSTLDRISRVAKIDKNRLHNILDGLCEKGLVVDLWVHNKYRYMLSPMVIGIFEFTMMRTGPNLNTKKWSNLFHDYLSEGSFFASNFGNGQQISVERALPHEEVIGNSEYVEILDYEKTNSIIDNNTKFAIGICSCRHEKLHIGDKKCDVPLEKCSLFGVAAEYMIRHNLAREVSKTEMLENFVKSKESGLVLNSDNVQNNITFICSCCKCCCNTLLGISKHGYPNVVVTSSFIMEFNEDKCTGCGICARDCPINAVTMIPNANPAKKIKAYPRLDSSICLGCGVCALRCKSGAARLVKRQQRYIHPETTFERVILQCLERGTLQNQIFDDPQKFSHKIMRGFVGGFLKLPPVKKALMSDTLRSSFLSSMKTGTVIQGKDWLTKM